jgi:hypothetical protein
MQIVRSAAPRQNLSQRGELVWRAWPMPAKSVGTEQCGWVFGWFEVVLARVVKVDR